MSGRSIVGALLLALLVVSGAEAGGVCADGARGAAPAGEARSGQAAANGAGAASAADSARTAAADSAAAGAADSTAGKGAADSTRAAAGDTTEIRRFVPTSTSYIRGGQANMTLGATTSVIMYTPAGWTIRNSVEMEKTNSRGSVDMQNLSQSIGSRATKETSGIYSFSLGIGQKYNKRTTLGLGRFGKDVVNDDQRATLGFTLMKPVLGASLTRIAFAAGGSRGLDDYKYDRSLNGTLSSTLHYLFKNVVKVGGGYGTMRRRESSEVGSIDFGAMPSSADTVRALMIIGGESAAKLLTVDYKRSAGQERRVTPPRGNSLEILDDPSKAKRERIKSKLEALLVNSALQPLPDLSMGIQLKHDVSGQTYAVDTALTKRSKSDLVAASVSYAYAKRGEISVDVRSAKSLDDFGPTSLSSFREREHAVDVSLSQKVGDSLSVSLAGQGWLKQRFFLKNDVNPRDADYLFYKGEISVRRPFRKISTGVRMMTNRYETINIDNTLSGDNRVDYQYIVVPQFSLSPTSWLRLSQEYTIKIDYTDFVYKDSTNYLNRTTQLYTRAEFTLSKPVRFNFLHAYYMKDTGSYLPGPAGTRLYDPDNENRQHSLTLEVRYEPLPEFTMRAAADFQIQRTSALRVNSAGHRYAYRQDVFESGGLVIGFVRTLKIRDLGEVNLDIAYNRRYGRSLTADRREFWDMESSINLNF